MAFLSGSDLIGEIRDRCDISGSAVVTDGEMLRYINGSLYELHAMKVKAYGDDYFISSMGLSSSNNVSDYALPLDTFKIIGVDQLDSSGSATYVSLKRMQFVDRQPVSNKTKYWGYPAIFPTLIYEYAAMGSNIKLLPVPQSTQYFTVWYVPVATTFASTTSVIDFTNGWEQWPIVDSCIKIKEKQEQDTMVFQGQRNQLMTRLNSEIPNRNAGDPIQIMSKLSRIRFRRRFW